MKDINSFISESLSDDKKVSDDIKKKSFNQLEIHFINVVVGNIWYFVNKDDADYDRIDFIIKDMKPTATLNQEKTGFKYKAYYDESKNIHIVLMLDYKSEKPIKYIVAPNTIK